MENRIKELQDKIADLEKQLKPLLQEELRKLYREREKNIEKRLKLALQGKGDFKLKELVYAADVTCHCGSGMAYPKNVGIHGNWECGDILLGRANTEVKHTGSLPFAFYEIKSENQPSANGLTTRPKE